MKKDVIIDPESVQNIRGYYEQLDPNKNLNFDTNLFFKGYNLQNRQKKYNHENLC